MHQHPRPPPKGASPASSPSTNPYRTNNPREGGQSGHSRFGSDAPQYSENESGGIRGDGVVPSSGPSAEARRKLDQIVQNFHTKAATVILQSRMSFPTIRTKDQTTKVNKWFQLETDDTDAFRDDLRLWKTCGGFENRPPPLILETYLDTSDLSNKQSLVIVDDNGKHWDVAEALNEAQGSKHGDSRHRKRHTEVILERWRIELKEGSTDETYDYGAILPTIYKKAIVFFRTLYATARFTPVSKFVKGIGKAPTSRGGLRINCRIINGESFVPAHHDPLTIPLFQGDGETTTRFNLGETESPAGPFSAEVCYRNDCNFRAADSEALLSERFMGAEDFFQPTLASRREDRRRDTRATEVGSLPVNRRFSVDVEPTQTYGSLSTFHGEGPTLAASPISALRAARNMGSETNSPPAGSSYAKYAQPSRPTSRANESIAAARRPSVSFNPFKAGSLSGSPLPGTSAPQQGEMLPPGSSQSVPRSVGMSALSQARNRSSLTAGMPASLRGIPVQQDNTISPSSSPKTVTINRYSSSFSHRRGRLSYGGTSRAEDDQGSSGKQSLSSSAQPGSGILAEATAGSSGSLQTDDDNISDFLNVLENNKNLPSFQQRGNEAATRRTASQLTRFQSMRESHNILTESLTSSMLLHRSSSSSSRQLSSVPPMVAATSISTSSSPGKPISPHTPHTPAIPSRLSANSIAEYSQPRRERTRSTAEEDRIDDVSGDEDDNGPGTTAIDIPLSPRPRQYASRRSSSVAQEQRTLAVDEDENDLPFHRSISLGADDREPPSLSDLRGFGRVPGTVPEETRDRSSQPAPGIGSAAMDGPLSCLDSDSPPVPRSSAPGSQQRPTRRPKVDRSSLSAQTGSSSSGVVDTRRAGSGERERTNRYSFSRPLGPPFDDDEYPLLFDMSEIGRNSEQSRRSLEDGREGAGAGRGYADDTTSTTGGSVHASPRAERGSLGGGSSLTIRAAPPTPRSPAHRSHVERRHREADSSSTVTPDGASAASTTPAGIFDEHKSRYAGASAAMAFPHVLGVALGPDSPPTMRSFAYNFGIRPEEASSPHGLLGTLISEYDLGLFSDIFFAAMAPVADYMDARIYTQRCRDYYHGSGSTGIAFGAVAAGVAALGSFLSPKRHPLESGLVHYAKTILDDPASMRVLGVDHIIAWAMRTFYLRATTRPNNAWMASCIVMHLCESVGLHEEETIKKMAAVAGAAVVGHDADRLRRIFWISWAGHNILSYEFDRSSVRFRAISCQGIISTSGSVADQFVKMGQIIPVPDSPFHLECEPPTPREELFERLKALDKLQVVHPFLVVTKADLVFCFYRRIYQLKMDVSEEIVKLVIDSGNAAVQAAEKLAGKGHLLWNVIGSAFQYVCVLLAIDTPAASVHIAAAFKGLENLVQAADTGLTREALAMARHILSLTMAKKRKELAQLEAIDGSYQSPQAQQESETNNAVLNMDWGLDWDQFLFEPQISMLGHNVQL